MLTSCSFGNSGDVGSLEISDFLFTFQGPTAGALLVEWNVHQSSPGNVAMWDCHFRVDGPIGSRLQLADCKLSGSINSNCKAASMLMHVTKSASGYFENVWVGQLTWHWSASKWKWYKRRSNRYLFCSWYTRGISRSRVVIWNCIRTQRLLPVSILASE
jgi:hypothetical protein